MARVTFRNTILRGIDDDAIQRLALRPIALESRQVLEKAGGKVEQLVFVEEGIASMTTSFRDGSQVESGMFGPEAAVGASALAGLCISRNNVIIQVPGHGWTSGLQAAQREFRRQERFYELVLRYIQSQVVQAAQSAGCNARHNVQQRLSRWLLTCMDRAETDVLQLTQEFLSYMLGVERPAVTVVAGKLQELGLIEYSRGSLRILDQKGLERLACECYQVVVGELRDFCTFADQLAT